MRTGQISFKVSPKVKKALKGVAAVKPKAPKVRVVGEVRRGKLEIDYKGLNEFSKKVPRSDIWFVALNAPFKTSTLTGSL